MRDESGEGREVSDEDVPASMRGKRAVVRSSLGGLAALISRRQALLDDGGQMVVLKRGCG